MPQMNRRDVLLAGLVGLGVALVGCDDDGGSDVAPAPDAAVPPETTIPESWSGLTAKLETWFEGAPPEAVHTIGRRYLAEFEDGAAIVADLGPLADALLEADEVVEFIEATIDADFGAVRLAGVAGWQFAVTEARLCGLSERLASI